MTVAEFHGILIAVQENSFNSFQRGVTDGLMSSCWPAISRVLGSGEIPSVIPCQPPDKAGEKEEEETAVGLMEGYQNGRRLGAHGSQ